MDCAYGAAQPAVSTLRSTRPLSSRTQESEMEVLKTHRTSGVQPRIATRSTDTRAWGVHIHPLFVFRFSRVGRFTPASPALSTPIRLSSTAGPRERAVASNTQRYPPGTSLATEPSPPRMCGGARPHPQATSGRTSTRIYHRASHDTSCSRRPPARSVPTHTHSRVHLVHRSYRITSAPHIHPHWHVSNPRAPRCR
jgi:hypothetical protein